MNKIGLWVVCSFLMLSLTGCGAEQVVNVGGPFHIVSVEMMGAEYTPQMDDLGSKVKAETRVIPQTDNPKKLKLTIVNFHKKNPGMSLLVGDTTNMNVLVQVVDAASGTVQAQFNSVTSTDQYINGVIGMVASAATSDSEAEARIDTAAANDIMQHLYGKKVWASFHRRPGV
jgi:hypothetical protein